MADKQTSTIPEDMTLTRDDNIIILGLLNDEIYRSTVTIDTNRVTSLRKIVAKIRYRLEENK